MQATQEATETTMLAPAKPAALLRGTQKGLEVIVDAQASLDAISADITRWLDKAPAFFKGSDVRLRIDNGPLPAGAIGRIDTLAQTFALRIVEVTAVPPPAAPVVITAAPSEANAIPDLQFAAGSSPTSVEEPPAVLAADEALVIIADEPTFEEPPTQTNIAPPLRFTVTPEPEPTPAAVPVPEMGSGVRIVHGPVRSGVVLEHQGNLIIFGDVNPGAEVRATGNIVVLGRLRGTAHAGIGQELGFILALRLEPQQLRVCRKVARAGDDAGAGAEIAYLTNDQIVVEPYQGKLPRNLASSI